MRAVRHIARALLPLVALSASALAQDDRFPQLVPPAGITTGSIPGGNSSAWSGEPSPQSLMSRPSDFMNSKSGPEAR